MTDVKISSIKFTNFKALENFSVSFQNTNILVGPNNSGKSTVISAFRILDVALKKARRRRAERVALPSGSVGFGHNIPEQQISVSLENVATNYNDNDSRIEFRLTNKNKLFLFFPNEGGCILHWSTTGSDVATPTKFRKAFPIALQVIPILGPLEHEETYVNVETVKNGLNTHRASRHFRNYWHYFSEGWDDFADMVSTTWPGMRMGEPELDIPNNQFNMYVEEDRVDREIYWAGLGFQIWCQLLTHLSRAESANLVIIDEPEIYLHPDVQRQLLNILRNLSSDILLATHSVEIMGEADPSEILLVDKSARSAKRLKDIEGVQLAFESLGSTQNVTLTHLARTKKIVFVEGLTDYKIIRRFAKILSFNDLASGSHLTAFESGGFSSWEKIKSFAWGVKNTIDADMKLFAIYDRDYYCQDELDEILVALRAELTFAYIHERKEIENYLLNIEVLERVLDNQIRIRNERTGVNIEKTTTISDYITELSDSIKVESQSQYLARRLDYKKSASIDASTISHEAIDEFENLWSDLNTRMKIVPGKKTLKSLRDRVQNDYSVNMTDIQIIDAFQPSEIPDDLKRLIEDLNNFSNS